jgi:hypothetical protein
MLSATLPAAKQSWRTISATKRVDELHRNYPFAGNRREQLIEIVCPSAKQLHIQGLHPSVVKIPNLIPRGCRCEWMTLNAAVRKALRALGVSTTSSSSNNPSDPHSSHSVAKRPSYALSKKTAAPHERAPVDGFFPIDFLCRKPQCTLPNPQMQSKKRVRKTQCERHQHRNLVRDDRIGLMAWSRDLCRRACLYHHGRRKGYDVEAPGA